jgi:hypothetical protein
MNERPRVIKQIEPVDMDELEKDLRFLYHNRTDTVDLFVDEAIPVFKYHLNELVARYQEQLLADLTSSLSGEIAGIIMRSRRETIKTPVEDPDDW